MGIPVSLSEMDLKFALKMLVKNGNIDQMSIKKSKCLSKSEFWSNVDKKSKCRSKSKFWAERKILIKNPNSDEKSKFRAKIIILIRNPYSGERSKFLSA